jgi:ketosteroid isomerase-like protein
MAMLAACFLCACGDFDQQVDDPTMLVRTMLESSAGAWNTGDLGGFIDYYANDQTTSFMDGRQPQYGYDWIRSNYAPRFGPGASRDSLRFEGFAARSLGNDHILATARYVLHRGDSVTSSGPFTLILERRHGEWKIIHDHTNSDPD